MCDYVKYVMVKFYESLLYHKNMELCSYMNKVKKLSDFFFFLIFISSPYILLSHDGGDRPGRISVHCVPSTPNQHVVSHYVIVVVLLRLSSLFLCVRSVMDPVRFSRKITQKDCGRRRAGVSGESRLCNSGVTRYNNTMLWVAYSRTIHPGSLTRFCGASGYAHENITREACNSEIG